MLGHVRLTLEMNVGLIWNGMDAANYHVDDMAYFTCGYAHVVQFMVVGQSARHYE